jgi:hypothetical protein
MLTVNVYDIDTGLAISGAMVTVVNSTSNILLTSGTTNSDGKTMLTLDNGGEYYLRAESPNHWPQVSDEFMIVSDHIWTMVLTPGVPNALQTIQNLQN